MNGNTDFKKNTTLTIVILVFLALALLTTSSAAAQSITVDGNGSDWVGLPAARLDTAVDSDGIMELTVNICGGYMLNWSSGYDMADFAMYYNASTDTLYFKINVSGVPGDTDGDYNPDSCTYCNFSGPNGNCTDSWDTWARASADHSGALTGAYKVCLDVDGDGNEDYRVMYKQNRVWVMDETETSDHSDNFTWAGSMGLGPWSAANVSNVVEMRISPAHNLSGFGMYGDLTVKEVSCGSFDDYLAEDPICQFTANRAPISIPVAENVCYCTNTSFNGSGSYDPDGTIVSHEWDFGDGNTSSGVTASHHYGAVGNYTVTLTVTDDYGFKCSNTTITWVYENPTANFTATEVCFCTNTTFTDATTGGAAPYTYAWDFDSNGTIDSTEANPSHHYPSPGSHTATLNVTDAHGCSDEITMSVHVVCDPVAVAKVNRSDVATPGGVVLFNGSDSTCDMTTTEPNSLVNYTWELHGKLYYGVTVPYYVTSNTTASLKVTDKYGCTNNSSVNVTYRHRPVPVINYTATGCLLVELNASNSSDYDGCITNYSWDLDNDGTYGDAFGITCTYNFGVGGNHTVGLNVTDNHNLTNTTTKVIYVSYKPTAVADVNRSWVATPGGWVLFSATNSTYDANVTNSLSYNWTIHGATYTGENVTYNVTNTTTAVLKVTDKYGCTNNSSVNVTYRHRPVPVINYTATGCLLVELNASNSSDHDGCITNYSWDLDNDGTYGDAFGITCTYNFGVGGNHTVGLNVTDNHNLTNTTTKVIYVSCVPTAAARANRTNVTAPGGMVLFDAPNSTCDMNVSNSLNYTWVINETTYHDSSGEGIEHFVTNTTTAFLTVTDEYNCTAADNVTVTCQQPPVAEFNFTGTGCKEGILNASASSDPDGNITAYEWDLNDDGVYDNGTGVTCTFGPVPVPPEDYWIGLKVTDDAGASNTTRKPITLTGDPDAVAKANGHNISIQLPSGGGWVVFDGTNSTAYPGTDIISAIWNIPDNGTYPGLGPLPPIFIDRDTTATLAVVANNTCTDVSRVKVLMPPTEEDVPILTPAGMIALIGILCIAGRGRITKKGGGS